MTRIGELGPAIDAASGTSIAPVTVLVDHREIGSIAAAALAALEGLTLEVVHLPVGDYQIDETFVFERKTLVDFTASVQDGRLFRQGLALAALPTPMRGVLILEGSSTDLAGSGMRRESLQGALITITLFFGVPVLRSMNGEETARLMVYAARQATRFATRALPRHGKRPKGKRKAQLALLQGIPGVGPDRGRRLLDRFGSVEAVLTSTFDDLAAVKGIGKRTAQNIRWIVSEPAASPYAPGRPPAPIR
jgi:ERCC4-type nuclease